MTGSRVAHTPPKVLRTTMFYEVWAGLLRFRHLRLVRTLTFVVSSLLDTTSSGLWMVRSMRPLTTWVPERLVTPVVLMHSLRCMPTATVWATWQNVGETRMLKTVTVMWTPALTIGNSVTSRTTLGSVTSVLSS